jgi:unsaturated rhamnogalacturonyl hydrolase
MKKLVILIISLAGFHCSFSQVFRKEPIEHIKTVADRTMNTTRFQLQGVVKKPNKSFLWVESINFGRTLHTGGVAYAYSIINSNQDREVEFQISHAGQMKIFVNQKAVYENKELAKPTILELERSWEMPNRFITQLKKGQNTILIKSLNQATKDWKFFIQPFLAMPQEGDVEARKDPLTFQLEANELISAEVATFTNWILIGPFQPQNTANALSEIFPPEKEVVIGKIYPSGDNVLAWEMPKIEMATDVFGAHPLWGSLYDWNYHTAGLAWAIGQLGDFTGIQKYRDYMNTYCDFMLGIMPYIEHEKYTMDVLSSRFSRLIYSPLLDFTSAPALPFIYRLMQEKEFSNRDQYQALVDRMQDHVMNHQLRLKDGTLIRETPEQYTLWVDDMFMGIPFLLHSAKYATNQAEKQRYLNDAANQVILYHKRLFDPKVKLFHHAWYSERPNVKLPYWSRANGWGVWATSEVLMALPKNHPQYKRILKIFQDHAEGLANVQNKDTGFWPNVLELPESFKETSGTAIHTLAIARGINEGWLNRKKFLTVAIKGWEALTTVMDDDGKVTDICMGTMCSEDYDYYLNRPVVDDDSHGLLGLVVAGIEMQRLYKSLNNESI